MILTSDEAYEAALKKGITSGRELKEYGELSGVTLPLRTCHRIMAGVNADFVAQRTLLKLTKVFRPGLFEQNRPRKEEPMAKPKPAPKPKGNGTKKGY